MPAFSHIIDNIVDRIGQASSGSAIDRQKLNAIVESALRRLDVVPRQEFDAQAAVLQKTRQQLDELKAQLDELEKRIPQ